MYLYRDIYYNIACFLTDYEIARTLDLVEHESHDLVRNRKLALLVSKDSDKLKASIINQYMDGFIEYYDESKLLTMFLCACRYGWLDAVKITYIDQSFWTYKAFSDACQYGHLDVAQFLYSRGRINLSMCNNLAFRSSCVNGHLHVVKWLLTLDNDISEVKVGTFWQVCEANQLLVAQLLYSLGGIVIDDINRIKPHTVIYTWLLTLTL